MTNSQSHYSADFLAARKQTLESQKESIEKELGEIARFDEAAGQYVPVQPEYDPDDVEDPADSGDEAEELEERRSRVNDLEVSLGEVNLALDKLDKGNYGRCESTGDWISEARLEAYPAAKTCMTDSE